MASGLEISMPGLPHLNPTSKLSVAQLVFVAEPTHPGLSSRLGTGARIILDLFYNLISIIFSVVGDVPANCEVPVVSCDQLTRSLGGAYKGRVAYMYS